MTTWALIVGINDYPAGAGQRQLGGAVADAADFADWTLHPNGGNVAPANLFLWTYPAPVNPTPVVAQYLAKPTHWFSDIYALDPWVPPLTHRPPTVAEIVSTALETGRTAAAAARFGGDGGGGGGGKRRIYVFLAGHGLQTNSTSSAMDVQTCFIAGEFRPNSVAVMGLLPCEDLRRALLAGGFDEVFMFLDCCRVAMTKLNMPAPTIASANNLAPPSPLWGVGNATQKNMVAFETTTAPTRGAFSKTLVDGLRTIRDANQQLTIDSLMAYVRDNIKTATANDQRPYFIADPNDPPPVLVVGPQIPSPQLTAPIRIALGSLAAGTMVQLVDDSGLPVGLPVAVAAPGTSIPAVPEGFYGIDVVGTLTTQAFKHVAPGGTDVTF